MSYPHYTTATGSITLPTLFGGVTTDHRPDILIDFDGTIHDYKHPEEGHRMGPPMPGAVNAVRWLYSRYRIVIFTVRGDQPYIRDWLRHFNIPFDTVTNIKVPGKIVDDNAIHFNGNWNQALMEVRHSG